MLIRSSSFTQFLHRKRLTFIIGIDVFDDNLLLLFFKSISRILNSVGFKEFASLILVLSMFSNGTSR